MCVCVCVVDVHSFTKLFSKNDTMESFLQKEVATCLTRKCFLCLLSMFVSVIAIVCVSLPEDMGHMFST